MTTARAFGARLAALTSALLTATLFQSLYHQPVNWTTTAALSMLLLLSAVRPLNGLLLLAGLGPVAAIVGILLEVPGSLRIAEAMTLAFLTGAAAHRAFAAVDVQVHAHASWTAAVLVIAALAAAIVQAAAVVTQESASLVEGALPLIVVSDYLVRADGVAAALQFAEGPLLVIFAAIACAADRGAATRVLRIMVAGATAAAVLNALRVLSVWLQQPDSSLLTLLLNLRVNVQYGDLNAAGSYFAMLCVFATSFMERGRWWASLAAACTGLALWMTGSRTALACAAVTILARAAYRMRGRSARENATILAALALFAVLAAAAWTAYPYYRNDRPLRALATRLEFAKAGLRMAKDHPVFGVGPGNFRDRSRDYAPAMLGVTAGENAHNQYIQILAELGTPALVLTVSLIAFALTRRPDGDVVRSWGLPAGIATFLMTALAGHPLLVPDVAYPFWIAIGLALGGAGVERTPFRARATRSRAWWLAAVAIFAGMLAGTLPARLSSAVRGANMERASSGLSKWQRDPDGTRWRWAAGRATFFVDASAKLIRIPLRTPAGAPDVDVQIFVDEREAERVRVTAGQPWRFVRFVLANRRAAFSRIDVVVSDRADGAPLAAPATDTSGALMIGQPIVMYEH